MNETESFILEHYQTLSIQEMADVLHTARFNIGYYLRKNGIRTKLQFSESDIIFMQQHYADMTYKEIGNVLGYTERQIRGKINHLGLNKNRKINDTYFDNIDSALKAYFLGFIFADGWIVVNPEKRNYEFGMELQSGDKYVLERLNQELGGLNIITHSQPCEIDICGKTVQKHDTDILRIYSKSLVLSLQKQGIATNKSCKDICPQISDEYFFDFLRGYIDGDGCYWKYKNHYYMHITCASEKVLQYLQQRLLSFNIETRLYCENKRKYRLMCVNIVEMQKLISHLYPTPDVFCLSRKYNRIKSYLHGSAA